MDQITDFFRGFDFGFGDNPIVFFLIIGAVVLLFISNGDIGCFLEQNNSLVWIILIVFLLFMLNQNNDDCCC